MVSKTLLGSTVREIEEKIEKHLLTSFEPTLAVVFCPVTVDVKDLSNLFTSLEIDLIGASSAGGIFNNEIVEKGIVVLLTDLEKSMYKIQFLEGNYHGSFEAGQELSRYSFDHFQSPAFILFFSMTFNGEAIIDGIKHTHNSPIPIYGGMAGNDTAALESLVFNNDNNSYRGLAALVLDANQLEVDGFAYCGWQPLGVVNKITSAKENQIFAINDKPVLEVINDFFGTFEPISPNRNTLSVSNSLYPLTLIRQNSTVLRAPLRIMEDDSLLLAGPVKEGDQFRFAMAPGFEVIDQTVRHGKEYFQQAGTPDFVMMVSCKARHRALGPLIKEEIDGVHSIFEQPMAGFFSYGEIGKLAHSQNSEYLNESCTIITIKKKHMKRNSLPT